MELLGQEILLCTKLQLQTQPTQQRTGREL